MKVNHVRDFRTECIRKRKSDGVGARGKNTLKYIYHCFLILLNVRIKCCSCGDLNRRVLFGIPSSISNARLPFCSQTSNSCSYSRLCIWKDSRLCIYVYANDILCKSYSSTTASEFCAQDVVWIPAGITGYLNSLLHKWSVFPSRRATKGSKL